MDLIRKLEWEEHDGKGRCIYVYKQGEEFLVETCKISAGRYVGTETLELDREGFNAWRKKVYITIKYIFRLEELGALRVFESYSNINLNVEGVVECGF